MIFSNDPSFWEGLWKVIVADIVLAGDNAVVIALAVRSLPARQQFWGRIFGAFGAVALRVLFVWIISTLLQVPFLRFAGGVLLIWIAVKLVQNKTLEAEDDHVRASTSLFEAIWIIVVADVVMSFDNVMAIAGASEGHMGLVIFGLLFSIPLVVLGSGLLATIMRRFPWMVWFGAGLLGHVAGEMILADPRARGLLGALATRLDPILPLGLGAFLVVLGWLLARGTPRAKEVLHVPE